MEVVETGGTLFPGLIELHNHLSYDALPLWAPVPKRFEHRGQWPDHQDYRPLISGPMTVIGEYRDASGQPALLPALVRYVECKCLLGGVTTSQGVRLASNAGIQRFYRGVVRNVEQTDDPELPEAQGRIPDVDARDARRFLARLTQEDSCFLLHLSEGVTGPTRTDSMARRHFLALEIAPGEWALNTVFTGIHAAGLLPEDFEVLARHGGAMVWSPLSNLLLYGATARLDAARAAGVRIGLGSDWSPTGSKNLLGELKVAWLASQHLFHGLLTARDLVAMATRDAARILKWQQGPGDARGRQAGRPPRDRRHGRRPLRRAHPGEGDGPPARHDQRHRALRGPRADGPARATGPDGARGRCIAPTLPHAGDGGPGRGGGVVAHGHRPAPRRAPRHRHARQGGGAADSPRPRRGASSTRPARPVWSLVLDEIQDRGVDLRPRLPFRGPRDFTGSDACRTRRRPGGAPPVDHPEADPARPPDRR